MVLLEKNTIPKLLQFNKLSDTFNECLNEDNVVENNLIRISFYIMSILSLRELFKLF